MEKNCLKYNIPIVIINSYNSKIEKVDKNYYGIDSSYDRTSNEAYYTFFGVIVLFIFFIVLGLKKLHKK